jgi:heptose-I-phosphate ethanolaminephosphotransferase
MAWTLINEESFDILVCYAFSMFFTSFGVAALVQILYNKRLKLIAKSVILAIVLVIFVIEFFAMYNYNILIGVGIVNSILETNPHEALEFFEMYLGIKEVLGVVGMAAVAYYLKKRAPAFCKYSGRRPSRILLLLLLIGAGYSVQMAFFGYDIIVDKKYLPLQRAYAASEVAVKNINAYREMKSKVNDNIIITENKSSIKNVVYIIGESANRNHMGLYGYYLPNTPNLSRMVDSGEMYCFTDTISPHSTTIAVLSKLFTFCDFESDKEWYEYNNLVDILNAAGYKTFWLSNQESTGIWGSVAQMYAERSQKHEFTRLRDSHEELGVLDEELLPLIDRAKGERGEKNFFFIHLMGQHVLYYNRYPYIFHKFTDKDIQMDINDAEKEIIAQYDNATYYNDYIVSDIIDRFRDDETLVIYASDHGEAVYDETGFSGHIEENPNRHMIEIPFVIWGSEKFRENYPYKIQQVAKAVDRPYMTDDMIHTVLDLLDIRTADFDATRSVVNDDFDMTRQRIFNGKDYDREIKNE